MGTSLIVPLSGVLSDPPFSVLLRPASLWCAGTAEQTGRRRKQGGHLSREPSKEAVAIEGGMLIFSHALPNPSSMNTGGAGNSAGCEMFEYPRLGCL